MNNVGKVKNQYMNDVVFAKDTIKTLEDTIYLYCPKDYFEVLSRTPYMLKTLTQPQKLPHNHAVLFFVA